MQIVKICHCLESKKTKGDLKNTIHREILLQLQSKKQNTVILIIIFNKNSIYLFNNVNCKNFTVLKGKFIKS